jgi:hypothetical protein
MNWKLIIVGTVVFWIVTNLIAIFGTGLIIHEGILEPIYNANASFWLPPLRENPPDMGALMPRWLLIWFVNSLVIAGIYSCVHTSFTGPGWRKGLNWGLCLGIFTFATYITFSGVIDLPMKLWVWWGIDALIVPAVSSPQSKCSASLT